MNFQNANLLMMGSVDEIPQAPVSKPVFLEDLNETQLARAVRLMNNENLYRMWIMEV